jgi:hypothetical protein
MYRYSQHMYSMISMYVPGSGNWNNGYKNTGRKLWLLLPPGEEKKVELTLPGNFVYDLRSQEADLIQAST